MGQPLTDRGLAQNRPVTSPTAPPPTLQDFEPLLLAEAILLRAAASGGIAKIGYQRPRNATPDVRLRAEFLAFLARGGGEGAPVANGRLQVLGACIVGQFDLRHATIPVEMWLYRCVFATAPLLNGAHVTGSLSFPDCALPGLQAEGLRVDGELAFNAGCSLHGELRLTRAQIGRDLNCERMQQRPSTKFSGTLPCRFIADGAQIGGDLNMSGGVDALGELRLRGMQVHGDLRASGARLAAELDPSGARGVALNLDRAHIGGQLLLDAGFSAAGQVRLQRAQIGGDLDATGAGFDAIGDAGWGDAAAVLLDRARIGGKLILQQLQRPLEGTSLIDARVGSLVDDAQAWGTHHSLDGFTYQRFGDSAPTDAMTRLGWLATQRARPGAADFRPDPWRRVIRVLRRMGLDRSASDVAIGRERHLRRIGLIGAGVAPALRWLPRTGHALWGALTGYGQRPLRLLLISAVLWLACAGAYWSAAEHGLLVAATPQPAVKAHTRLRPFAHSLDVMLPLLDLHEQRRWVPVLRDGAYATPAGAVQLLTWAEALWGWLAAIALLAIATGATDRDRRV